MPHDPYKALHLHLPPGVKRCAAYRDFVIGGRARRRRA